MDEARFKDLSDQLMNAISPVAGLACRFVERAKELRPENIETIGDFLKWVDRVTKKAHLIGYDPDAMSKEAVYRVVAMNAVVQECTGKSHGPQIARSRDLDDLSNVLASGLRDDMEALDTTTQLSEETRCICEAYVEQIHTLGLWP